MRQRKGKSLEDTIVRPKAIIKEMFIDRCLVCLSTPFENYFHYSFILFHNYVELCFFVLSYPWHVFFNVCLHLRSFPLRADWRKSDS